MNRNKHIALVAIILALAAACLMQFLAADTGDKGWLLVAAKMWLEGRRIDVDIVEVNPPLVIWLYAIPVWLSARLPFLSDANVLALTGLAASCLCAWLGVRLIRLHPALAGDRRGQLWCGLLLLSLFVFFTPPSYFFDREHILLVCCFPYLLRFMPGLAGKPVALRLRMIIGLLAALGFCIKPYTVIVFAGIQLTYVIQRRSLAILWSVENCIIYAFGALYLFCVWHFTPEYFTTVLPMALATYSAFSRRTIGLFYAILALITAGVIFADFRRRFTTPFRRDVYYFIGAALAMAAYAFANNGWGYTYHPLLCLLLFLAGWVGYEQMWLCKDYEAKGLPVRQFVFGMRACVILLMLNAAYMLLGMKSFYAMPACDWSRDCNRNRPYVQYINDNHITSFGALTENFHKWASLSRLTGATLDTRYNALWMVPQLVNKGEAFTQSHRWIVDDVGHGLADDLDTRKPLVVFVDDKHRFFGYDTDLFLPDFFASVPEFATAWSHYRYAQTIDHCAEESGNKAQATGCRYDIYRRTP